MAACWYIVHVYSGFEKKVAQAIEERARKEGLDKKFLSILVPTEEVVEIKRGEKVTKEQQFFPGYVLVHMDLDDQTWHLVRSTPKVTGFLGDKGRPIPVSDAEVSKILQQMEDGVARPKSSLDFEVGERIKICDGPFTSFNALVEEVDRERLRLKVLVSVFGRSTPVELEFTQVEKT